MNTTKLTGIVKIAVMVIITVFLIINAGLLVVKNINTETFTVTVTDKLRATYGFVWQTHKYLIFTVDEATDEVHIFENTDTAVYPKFNSSDYYARLEIGRTYRITAVGYRFPFWSLYKNIIKIELVE
jgi:hypothetical protein